MYRWILGIIRVVSVARSRFLIMKADRRAAMSAFLDIALSLLPIYFMWQIQLSTKLKAGICGLMSLGLL